jgi:hypothetical protein
MPIVGSPLILSGGVIVNQVGSPHANFRVETNTKTHGVFVDAGEEMISFLSASGVTGGDGTDNAFFVSGSAGSIGTTTRGTSVFGGDLYISGALVVSGNQGPGKSYSGGSISGSIHRTSTGLSYLVAGANTTVSSASNGQVTISSTGGGGGGGGATDFGWFGPAAAEITTTGSLGIGTAGAASLVSAAKIQLNVDGGAVFNYDGDAVDFRVESDNEEHALFIEGASDRVYFISGTTGGSALEIRSDRVFILSGTVGDPGTSPDESTYTDVNFFVSGSQGSRGTAIRGTAVFGGDVVISGSIYGASPLHVEGSGIRVDGGAVFNEVGSPSAVFRVETNNEQHALYIEGASDRAYFMSGTTGGSALEVRPDRVFVLSGTEGDPGTSPDESTYTDVNFFVSGTIGSRGTPTKGTSVFGGDVVVSGGMYHTHDPASLAANTGYGDILTIGDEVTAPGSLYYYAASGGGTWTATNARAVASGGSQLLGIALGTTSAQGMLTRGYAKVTIGAPTPPSEGEPIYISTTASEITGSAPSSVGQVVRLLGWSINTGGVIYFNPSNDWIEL